MTFPQLGPQYIVLRLLDSGGEADVYELRHGLSGSRYAARVLREAWDPVARCAFREGVLRQLRASGPGIARILAYNFEAPKPFAVLEYMPHGSLKDELSRRTSPLELREALELALHLAELLAGVHAKRLAHLDFKPGNILKNNAGSWELADFGAAVTVGPHELLRADRWVLTPEYAAPEQLLGVKTQASDVYALGIVLNELLTGSAARSLDFLSACHGSWEIAMLVARLTAADPKTRPSAREVVTLLRDSLSRATSPQILLRTGVPATATAQPAPAEVSPMLPRTYATPSWLTAAGFIATAVLGVAAVNRATKRWDPASERYRGSTGRFRGGGLFE